MTLFEGVLLLVLVALGIRAAVRSLRRKRQRRILADAARKIPVMTVQELDPAFVPGPMGPPREASEVVFLGGGHVLVPGSTTDFEAWILAVLAKSARRCFEFGTCTGRTTYLWARNSPTDAVITTLTLAPEHVDQYQDDQSDDPRDAAVARSESVHDEFLYSGTDVAHKVQQLFGDSKAFDETPYLASMDLIFIDGSHAYSYVLSDSQKALRMVKPGGLILWHDYEGPETARGTDQALLELANELPLRVILGTRMVAYRAPSAEGEHERSTASAFHAVRPPTSSPRRWFEPVLRRALRLHPVVRPTAQPDVGLLVHKNPDDIVSQHLVRTGMWEPAETELLLRLLKPGMTMLDIGANLGYMTVIGSRAVGPAGRVIAFEPEPDNYALLARNVARNGCRNVELHQAAAGHRVDDTLTMFLAADNYGDHRTAADPNEAGRPSITISSTTVDAVVGARPVDVIKMDIQGGEGRALEGMRQTLATNPAVVLLMEFWPYGLRRAGTDPRDVLQFLGTAGFGLRLVLKDSVPPSRDHEVTARISAEELLERTAEERFEQEFNILAVRGHDPDRRF